MVHSDIEELLSARLGFDIETIGAKAVATMIGRAMEHAGFTDTQAYAWVLRHEPEAWDRFVDHLVIPETWFFRDVAPFELVADLNRAHMASRPTRPFRILSCPCSTGEEPYSLVLSILHSGAAPESFTVDAVDVSRRALEVARAAVFNPRSFRGSFPWDREAHFDRNEGEDARRVSDFARAHVTFRQGNMIAHDFLQNDSPYDVVFCRNLLIYLHMEARGIAMRALRRLVAENGVLVLGHAETTFAREHGFKPTGPIGAFAFVKTNERLGPKVDHPDTRAVPTRVAPRPIKVPIVNPVVAPVAQPAVDPLPAPQPLPQTLLEKASRLGDAGQLHSALEACNEYLQQVPASAEGYFLLGVLHDALGHEELAVSSFRKVLYLDPNHGEALLWLALKQEARGDRAGAELLRERARRIQQEEKPSRP